MTHSHLTVVERRPPTPQIEFVGRIYNIVQEPEPDPQFSRVNIEPEDLEDDDEVAEAKVVKARRGKRRVTTSEVAETE